MSLGYNITRSVAPKSVFEDARAVLDATISISQGALVYLDTTNHLIKELSAEANALTFLGVSPVTIVNGKIQSPYNTAVVASQALQSIPGPKYGVVAKLTLKTGDSLVPGSLIYADPVTGKDGVSAAGTKVIGVYEGAAITTAAAGTQVEVLLGARYPEDVLKF